MGSGIKTSASGSFADTLSMLKRCVDPSKYSALSSAGENGVAALIASTPVRTGLTLDSWSFNVKSTGSGHEVEWTNSNTNEGYNIALLLQYGHGTGTGGYYQGVDFINPAIGPVCDETADNLWKEVTG